MKFGLDISFWWAAIVLAIATTAYGNALGSNKLYFGLLSDDNSSESESIENFGDVLLKYLDAVKRIMPCGVPSLGIPQLAPFREDKLEFNSDDENLQVHGSISNLLVAGLNNYEFVGRSYEETTNKFTYDMFMPELHIMGDYALNTTYLLAGWPVTLNGEGLIDTAFKDIRVVGEFAFTPINNNTGVQLSDYEFKLYIGDVALNNWNNLWDPAVNNFFNRYISQLLQLLVEETRNMLSQVYVDYLMPQVNDALSNISVNDIINLVKNVTQQLNEVKCHRH